MDQKQGPKGSQPGTETQTPERPLPDSYPTVGGVTDLGYEGTSKCGNTTNRPPGENPTSRENKSEEGNAIISQNHSEQIKNECSDALQVSKEEKTEESIQQEPAEIATEGSFNISSGIKMKAEEKRIGAGCEIPAHLGDETHAEYPGKDFSSVKSGEDTSYENIEEMDMTDEHSSIKQEQSCEEPFNLSSIRNVKAHTDRAEGTGPSQKTVNDTGVWRYVYSMYSIFSSCCVRKCKP